MTTLRELLHAFLHAGRNLLPIVVTVAAFQALVLQQMPDDLLGMGFGLLLIVVGMALFLQGLELAIFPAGKELANQLARRGSVSLLLTFGFAIGFAAVIAEPALISVAERATALSDGRLNAFVLRLVVALSVGLMMLLGILRILAGHSLLYYLLGGYALVAAATLVAPEEIRGLAYDTGGVTTNMVTVPLIAALGVGLAVSLQGRTPLKDGFGMVALIFIAPMISVQLLGLLVFKTGSDYSDAPVIESVDPVSTSLLTDFLSTLGDLLPILSVILVFQFLVLRRQLAHPQRFAIGLVLLASGMHLFIIGLELGLFPVGASVAEGLAARNLAWAIYLFAFCLGFATTLAEPALVAVGRQAEEAANGRVKASILRLVVAVGVAMGLLIGVARVVQGASFPHWILLTYTVMLGMMLISPRYILALAFDLGAATVSAVTVPLITVLGVSLASGLEGRDPLVDGFGLIAFASAGPILTVMLYAISADLVYRWRTTQP